VAFDREGKVITEIDATGGDEIFSGRIFITLTNEVQIPW